ncbi:hypothetical protein ADICYQ_4798 [Cyclobacterium qasimii M12-11B]|uniref:Uncharacterized protein n=1 Tax=Cyclobacterium qasimii M12-11B TaxID=641524 RepID=S7V7A8_9BACT|nr:hypothetical protein ADICYQ_4798 [Cyclobacterium qasimii M12-11B]
MKTPFFIPLKSFQDVSKVLYIRYSIILENIFPILYLQFKGFLSLHGC